MDCREEQHLAKWVEEAEHLAGSRTQKKHPVAANNRETDLWLLPGTLNPSTGTNVDQQKGFLRNSSGHNQCQDPG